MSLNIQIIGEATYLLNNRVKVTIDEDLMATAEYDDAILTKEEVEKLIDDFFAFVEKNIKDNNS